MAFAYALVEILGKDAESLKEGMPYCIENNETLESLSLDTYKKFHNMFEEDVYNAVALETCLNSRQVVGGPSSKVEKENIERIEKKVSDYHD